MKTYDRIGKTVLVIAVMLALFLKGGIVFAQSGEEGLANFYSDGMQGKKMANGTPYDKTKLTASHKKYAFGTKVKVTNIENGKSVVVTVTDRMGQKNPAVIELSRRAADELGFAKSGKAQVKVETASDK
jgi:rare lipoprotein A